eukprot:TRINITY_DN815_c0_g1_i1.p1 TRINITY_DN815_c0_g1~~TRINITY_DN815_c0_g1_i1.p1  ORF type:complete len:182 (+),score=27.47 TRINITY_DN815_c0_g1_i1:167-712(+)
MVVWQRENRKGMLTHRSALSSSDTDTHGSCTWRGTQGVKGATGHLVLALDLLLVGELEVLAALEGELLFVLALGALEAEHDLLGGLGLLVEDGLGLTSETALLAVVTALTLGEEGSLADLVLGHLVGGVLAASLGLAEGVAGLGDLDHCEGEVWIREDYTDWDDAGAIGAKDTIPKRGRVV